MRFHALVAVAVYGRAYRGRSVSGGTRPCSEQHPRDRAGCWARIQARQEFMRKELGIQLPDEVLPLSDLQGVCFPYLADLNVVLACR